MLYFHQFSWQDLLQRTLRKVPIKVRAEVAWREGGGGLG